MILSETKYAVQDYERLVLELLQSPDIDAEFQYHPKSILNQNPHFFLLMFQALGKIKEAVTNSSDFELLSKLNQFEAKLYEYTDVLPTDLPDSILRDRLFIKSYLEKHRTIHFIEQDWQNFQIAIIEKTNSIPKSQQLPFLEWCLKMLNMNWGRHKKVCTLSGNCNTDIGFDKRVQFTTKLLEEYTPTVIPSPQITDRQRKGSKIQWLGTQKELAELFIRLRAKGWIVEFEPDAIKGCFTNSKTIEQYLKPGDFTEDLGGTFEQVFTKEYISKFHGIPSNPKQD